MERIKVMDMVHGLRELAEFLSDNADNLHNLDEKLDLTIYTWNPDQMVDIRRKLKGHGQWDKFITDSQFSLCKQFGEFVKFTIYGSRTSICEAVTVGTETVEVPDYDNRVPVPMKTVERPIIEYRCPPSLGGSHPVAVGE